MGELRGGKPEEIDEQIDYLFSALDILEWANTPGNLLSGGIKRLTAFLYGCYLCQRLYYPGRTDQ